jgi:hypothetical protein
MNDKKNIDYFFQEKFKDFEVEPNEIVWKNIEANLKNKKNKRRAIPFWLQLSGIAAALLIGMFSFNSYFGKTDNLNKVVLKDKSLNKEQSKQNSNKKGTTERSYKNIVNQKNTFDNVVVNKNNNSDNEIAQKEGGSLKTKVENSQKQSNQKNQIANKIINSNASLKKTEREVYALNKNKKAKNNFNSNNPKNTSLDENQAKVSKLNDENNWPNQIVGTNKLIENIDKLVQNITEEKLGNEKLDAVTKVETVPNALEELLKKNEEEKKKIAKTKIDRWQITSNIAPIYFNSTNNGSPIDNEFSENKKTYENNLSLGLGVNYAVSKKLKVRSGINKLTLAYSTKEVFFQAGLGAKSLKNIANSSNGTPMYITNRDNSIQNLMPFEQDIDKFSEGQLNQKMGYLEVPLEMSYTVLDKKVGINLIGGLSTLFLTENNVYISSTNMMADLGKATNLSTIHFSTNFGVGFKYKVFKAFEAKLEPTFKYQISTFSNDVGGFKPYFIGLYSGVSYSF